MATGLNLGSFASGFAQGFGDSQKMRLAGEAAQREQERLGYEKQRLDMEAQNQTRLAESHQQAMQLQKLQLEEESRKAESAKKLREKAAQVKADLDAPYEAKVYDPITKKETGTIRFSDPDQKAKELASQGKTFVPGSIKETGPVTDELARQRAMLKAMVQHQRDEGMFDPNQEAALDELNRKYNANEIEKVMMDWRGHRDSKKAFDSLKKLGVDFGPNAVLYEEVDPDTQVAIPTIGTRGKDGKIKKEASLEDVWLMSRDPEGARKEKREEKKALQKIRKEGEVQMNIEGFRQRGAMDRTVYEQNAAAQREMNKAGKGQRDEIRKVTLDFLGKFAQNPLVAYNPGKMVVFAEKMMSTVNTLVNKGVDVYSAPAMALKMMEDAGVTLEDAVDYVDAKAKKK